MSNSNINFSNIYIVHIDQAKLIYFYLLWSPKVKKYVLNINVMHVNTKKKKISLKLFVLAFTAVFSFFLQWLIVEWVFEQQNIDIYSKALVA